MHELAVSATRKTWGVYGRQLASAKRFGRRHGSEAEGRDHIAYSVFEFVQRNAKTCLPKCFHPAAFSMARRLDFANWQQVPDPAVLGWEPKSQSRQPHRSSERETEREREHSTSASRAMKDQLWKSKPLRAFHTGGPSTSCVKNVVCLGTVKQLV